MDEDLYFLKLDHILGLIRFEKEISEEDIFLKHKTELAKLNLNDINLELIFKTLTKDGYIIKYNSKYQLTPKGEVFFGGYTYQKKIAKVKESKEKKLERWFKIIPIILTIIATSSAIYYNQMNKEKNGIIKIKNETIDSLQRVIILNDKITSDTVKGTISK